MLQELRQIRRLFILNRKPKKKKEYSQFKKEQNMKLLEVKNKRPKLKTH